MTACEATNQPTACLLDQCSHTAACKPVGLFCGAVWQCIWYVCASGRRAGQHCMLHSLLCSTATSFSHTVEPSGAGTKLLD